MAKRKRPRQTIAQSKNPLAFKITFDPIPNPDILALPRKTQDEMDRIAQEVYGGSANLPTQRVRELHEKYPHIPLFANWLLVCMKTEGNKQEARALVSRTFLQHPTYLFARLNMVDLLIEDGEWERAEEVLFGAGKSLREIYPDRQVFHVSEVRGWHFNCARLCLFRGDVRLARIQYEFLRTLEPDHPMVRELERMVAFASQTAKALGIAPRPRKRLKGQWA